LRDAEDDRREQRKNHRRREVRQINSHGFFPNAM
jgi:hypothetical protein